MVSPVRSVVGEVELGYEEGQVELGYQEEQVPGEHGEGGLEVSGVVAEQQQGLVGAFSGFAVAAGEVAEVLERKEVSLVEQPENNLGVISEGPEVVAAVEPPGGVFEEQERLPALVVDQAENIIKNIPEEREPQKELVVEHPKNPPEDVPED
jgi:hypothetical protein